MPRPSNLIFLMTILFTQPVFASGAAGGFLYVALLAGFFTFLVPILSLILPLILLFQCRKYRDPSLVMDSSLWRLFFTSMAFFIMHSGSFIFLNNPPENDLFLLVLDFGFPTSRFIFPISLSLNLVSVYLFICIRVSKKN